MDRWIISLCLGIIFVIGSGERVASQQVVSKPTPVSKIGQFSLRNDGEDLRKPIGAPILLKPKEEVKEVKKTEAEIPVEEIRPIIPKPSPLKPEEVKKEEMVKKEERLGLKFAEGEEKLPKVIAKVKIPPKSEIEPVMPEESKYFLQLSGEEEPLPQIKPEAPKPKVVPPKLIPKKEKKKEEIMVKAEKVEEIIPSEHRLAKQVVTKESKFTFQRINPVLKWGIILSGLLTLILILLLRYLWRQKELASLAERVEVPAKKPLPYKSLVEDIKELQTGYRELEKMIENVEKKLTPITSLKGMTIEELTRETSKDVLKPIETVIKEIQTTYQGLEKLVGEFDKRLAPLDALKGLSIKELAHQTSMEFYRPLENEFKKLQISNERMMNEFEEKIDKKIDSIAKKSKNLEKAVGEIDSRLITIDSIVASLPKGETAISKPVIKPEEVKLATVKDKRAREILHNQIYKLSDEGLSIDEIAQRTKLGKGEVRLILGLRKR